MPSGAASSSQLGGGTPGQALAGVLLEQSPAARSSKAPSDPPSEFSSWHDDASSSLATFSAGDRTITVNMQRARMGEHLKGKLEGMIRQRFEDYLRIAQTLQNETGKLAALECELRMPRSAGAFQARTSISCNEDGTFFVYTVPDFSTLPRSPASSSFGSQAGEDGSETVPVSAPQEDGSETVPVSTPQDGSCPAQDDGQPAAGSALGTGLTSPDDGGELLRLWVKQVCEFGMSGCCHSLTALFDFGYTAWKQLLVDCQAEDLWTVRPSSQDQLARSHIAEEEERPAREEELPQTPAPPPEEPPAEEPAAEELPAAAVEARPLTELVQEAKLAAECERYQQALELCTEGIARAQAFAGPSAASSSSTAPPPRSAASSSWAPPGGFSVASSTGTGPDAEDAVVTVWQLLSLRASVQVRLYDYNEALRDAEEIIALQPTCAEGYYWQSTALRGMGRSTEALEALMSALEYEPQNPLFQQAFTSLFEEISAASVPAAQAHGGRAGSGSTSAAAAGAPASPPLAAASAGGAAAPAVAVLQGRRPRGRPAGDALSTTTQATRLSSRSTTPTEVSAPLSHSSSNDSLSVPAFDEPS